jgi:hypothetical protein
MQMDDASLDTKLVVLVEFSILIKPLTKNLK